MGVVEGKQSSHPLDAALRFITLSEVFAPVVKIQELLKPGAEARTGLEENLVYRGLMETDELGF